MNCEHKIVLAIYKESPHTKYNISHFRCPGCGETSTSEFGEKTIFEHERAETTEKPEENKNGNQ